MSDLESCMRMASEYAVGRTEQLRAELIVALSTSTHENLLLLLHMLAGEIEDGDPEGAKALRAVLSDISVTSPPELEAGLSPASAVAIGREPTRFTPRVQNPAQSSLAARLRK